MLFLDTFPQTSLAGVNGWGLPIVSPVAPHSRGDVWRIVSCNKTFSLLCTHNQTKNNNTMCICRDYSRFVPSQWETALLCNAVFHWQGAGLESALIFHGTYHRLQYCMRECNCLYWNRKLISHIGYFVIIGCPWSRHHDHLKGSSQWLPSSQPFCSSI